MLQLNVPHHQVTCESLTTKTHRCKSLAGEEKQQSQREVWKIIVQSHAINCPQENRWRNSPQDNKKRGEKLLCFLWIAVACVHLFPFQLRDVSASYCISLLCAPTRPYVPNASFSPAKYSRPRTIGCFYVVNKGERNSCCNYVGCDDVSASVDAVAGSTSSVTTDV